METGSSQENSICNSCQNINETIMQGEQPLAASTKEHIEEGDMFKVLRNRMVPSRAISYQNFRAMTDMDQKDALPMSQSVSHNSLCFTDTQT